MASRGRPGDEQVHLVTSAQRAHSEEMHGRTRRYLISMGIRTVCLVLAIFVAHGWLRLVFVAAAIALPWVAVVLANAGPVENDQQPEFIGGGRPELRAAPDQGDAPAGPDDETPSNDRAHMGNAAPADRAAGVADNAPPRDSVPPRDSEPRRDSASSETMAGRRHGAG